MPKLLALVSKAQAMAARSSGDTEAESAESGEDSSSAGSVPADPTGCAQGIFGRLGLDPTAYSYQKRRRLESAAADVQQGILDKLTSTAQDAQEAESTTSQSIAAQSEASQTTSNAGTTKRKRERTREQKRHRRLLQQVALQPMSRQE